MKKLKLIIFSIWMYSCGSSNNNCTILIDSSILNARISYLTYNTGYAKTQRLNFVEGKREYKIEFGDLGHNDGIIKFQFFSDTSIICSSYLYYTNGYLIGNEYIISTDSLSNCLISLKN